jgi:hypothetical protein
VTYTTESAASSAPWLGWRKSSRSANNGACVEVATDILGVAVRDSKHPDRATLRFPSATWTQFLADVKAGAFDL